MSKCVVVLTSESGSSVAGVLTLKQASVDSNVTVSGEIRGCIPGKAHAMAILTYGDVHLEQNERFNPFGKPHGLPTTSSSSAAAGAKPQEVAAGSLGNVTAGIEDGKVVLQNRELPSTVQLYGPHSVIGRLLCVYASEDDGGRGGHENSLATGNAGPRVAAGVIGIGK